VRPRQPLLSDPPRNGSANGSQANGVGSNGVSSNGVRRPLTGSNPGLNGQNGHANGPVVSTTPTRTRLPAEPGTRGSHRVAPGLPPQPRPIGTSNRPADADPPIRTEPMSGLVGTGLPRPGVAQRTGGAGPAPHRVPVEAGEPYPPISGRPQDGVGTSLMDQKRITPRSPRAALEPEHVTEPTRRSRRVRNPLVIVGNAIFTLLILVAIAGGVAFAVGKTRFETPGPLEEEKAVNIPPGRGILDIAELLRKEGVIDEHPAIFLGGVFALKAQSSLKHGEYVFAKRSSVREVVETLVEGKVVQHTITMAEGLTSEQIVRRLLDNDILTGNIKDVPHEGSLLPETYRVGRGAPREQVIQRMQRDQKRVLQEIWERRISDLPVKTPEQLVILASIIEKETSRPEERTRVAAVFVNRLKQRKRLESDPTIIYGLVGGKGSLGHPITRSEKETPTPYNTYMIDGLPPGPIANPGRASLEAAANPARTRELYFVADGTGGHVFSETYEQHLRNVARLRVIEAGERSSSAATAYQPEDAGARVVPAPARPKAKATKKQ
jgi:UPF0755 protein